jgi:hypothetical protein
MKKNCWELIFCGREPNGTNVDELGVCPAAIDTLHDKKSNGENGGRYCWRIAGTMCGGKIQGEWATKIADCHACKFYQFVEKQEGDEFTY